MFLHIGDNESVFLDSIIGVFDLESTTTMSATKKFFTVAESENQVITSSDRMPKSFVITDSDGDTKVFVSSVNASTIKKRIKLLEETEFNPNEYDCVDIIFKQEDVL